MTAHLRQNLPLYGLLLVLLLMAGALGVWSTTRSGAAATAGVVAMVSGDPAGPATPPSLATLPATAQDDLVITSELPPADARGQNARVPFAATYLTPAPPFRFSGSATDRARARECLALAGLAEAGGGDADQRAVMQVILNRARHPAFSNTVCGVVFQGSERTTGCQFTFTCDGSLRRTYSDALWRAATRRADEMLGGAVYAPVGNATHYHTDWVFPWWSPKLDKIAQVGTHLFLRWRGFWGSHAALSARYPGGEPDPAALRARANGMSRAGLILPEVPDDVLAAGLLADEGALLAAGDGLVDGVRSPGRGVQFLLVSATDEPAALAARSKNLCAGLNSCQVFGWSSAADMPAALPVTGDARRTLRFSYVPAGRAGPETMFFDCRLFPASPPGTCLPGSAAARSEPPRAATARSTSARGAAPAAASTAAARSSLPEPGALKADAQAGTLRE